MRATDKRLAHSHTRSPVRERTAAEGPPKAVRREDDDLRRYAIELRLHVAPFDSDRSGEAVLQRVRRDVRSGIASGEVRGTPTLFIDGFVNRAGYDVTTLFAVHASEKQ